MNLQEIYQGCRTYRRFEQKPVPKSVMMMALDNARIASSASNKQILRYVAVTDPQLVAQLQPMVHWAGYLPPEIGTPRPDQYPTAFIAMIKTKPGSDIDVGISANTIVTTAWESGIGSCLMGAINRPQIKELLQIGEEEELSLMIALGYPSHESHIVPMVDDDCKYSIDALGDFVVPKRSFDDIVSWR